MSNVSESPLFHSLSPFEHAYWTGKMYTMATLELRNGTTYQGVALLDIENRDNSLYLIVSTMEGNIPVSIDQIPGLKTVRGDSSAHPYEIDGEPLIECTYFKVNTIESKPRRIRPTGIKFGIMGDTARESAEQGTSHRAMGERADYYLVGVDTQYDPAADARGGSRVFPFWRLGVWGDAVLKAKDYLPK